jgi:hypothetical protein
MLRFPDRPDALPLNLIWNFETTSINNFLKNEENLECQKYVKYVAKNQWWATMSAMLII